MVSSLPPSSAPCWQSLATGGMQRLQTPLLAAQLLAKRVERSTDPIPAKAAEIRAFFVKYERLLADERMLMVFPEGTRGTAKLYRERYSLVQFGTGFMRLAQKMKTPIVPFAFMGGGEAVPTISNAVTLGKLLGLPYIPVTPWLVAVPLPAKLEVYYSEPMFFEGTGSEEDEVVAANVEKVKDRIASLIETGKKRRRGEP